MPENITDRTVFSLLEVQRSIQKTLTDRYGSSFWIKAEMNKLNYYKQSGHCYPELVEKQAGQSDCPDEKRALARRFRAHQ